MSTDVPGNAQPIKPALTLKDTASPMKSNCLDERVTGRDFLTEESYARIEPFCRSNGGELAFNRGRKG